MKGEACEERRNDSYLSCLLGPERQARTEERNGHCFGQELRSSHGMGNGDTVGPTVAPLWYARVGGAAPPDKTPRPRRQWEG